jgi:hypothetical protein
MPEPKTSSPETANPESPETANPQAPAEKPQASRLEEIARLLGEPTDKVDAEESSAPGKAAEKPKDAKPPKALKELAERLELKPEDLYAIEIPMSDGKSKTLGQLKDLAGKEGDLTARELRIEEERTRKESDLLRSQNELRELVSALPKDALKPEVVNAIRQKHEQHVSTERARTLELIPEWRDETKRTEEIAGMVEHLKGYGFPAQYLQAIYDSRALKYIRENMLREQRIRKALEQVQPAKPAATTKSKPNGAPKSSSAAAPPKLSPRLTQLLGD